MHTHDAIVIGSGHHGCGGVKAAMGDADHGLIDNGLRTVKDPRDCSWPQFAALEAATRLRRPVELNLTAQATNPGRTHIIRNGWQAGRRPMIHGWVFDLASGFLRRHTGEVNGNHAMHEVCKFHGAGTGAPA